LDANNRLRIATRIHFALLRHLGEGIAVATMLANDADAREVLWVCEASGDAELMSLARKFIRASRPAAPVHAAAARAAAPGGHVARDSAWAHDTSGFGFTQPPIAAARRLR
jgi:hypothetical protein